MQKKNSGGHGLPQESTLLVGAHFTTGAHGEQLTRSGPHGSQVGGQNEGNGNGNGSPGVGPIGGNGKGGNGRIGLL